MKRLVVVLAALAGLLVFASCVANPRLGVGVQHRADGGLLYADGGTWALANPVPGAPQAPQACTGPECSLPQTAAPPPFKVQVEAPPMPSWGWPVLIVLALVAVAWAFRDRIWPPRKPPAGP